MAFKAQEPIIPTTIGDISVVFTDFAEKGRDSTVHYSVQIMDQDGSVIRVATGDLLPHFKLTLAQKSLVLQYAGILRAKAEKEILNKLS